MMIDLLCFCEVTTDFTAAQHAYKTTVVRTCTAVKQLEVLRSLLLSCRTNVLLPVFLPVNGVCSFIYEYEYEPGGHRYF